MADAPAIVWLRQDLRLADNPALTAAVDTKRPVILLYILDDETPGRWKIGGAQRWWLHHSLESLDRDARRRGGALAFRRGRASDVLPRFAAEIGAAQVFWNRCYEPFAIARDTGLKTALANTGVEVKSFNGALLFEPWEITNKSGGPFKVFTPFWRACLAKGPTRAPLPAPRKLRAPEAAIDSDPLPSWRLAPSKPNWASGFEEYWRPGEAGAHERLNRFLDAGISGYAEARDTLADLGTSMLSPHLHWGEISPTQVRAAVEAHVATAQGAQRGADKFLAELGWREFAHHLLYHAPGLPDQNWRNSFDAFPWRTDDAGFETWTRGQTGYPVVDAAMRQLWATGYMHNRARMIVASFLVKHLLIDWRRGEDWFWDTLVDADLANNAASWQWVAGSGADAAPYFRIFNPVAQGERYDTDGAYVRRWVPELSRLPATLLHKPWEADAATLAAAGVTLGRNYPAPVVDHKIARTRALEAYAFISSSG